MTLGIMQPYFFPYIGYFQLIHSVDRFLLYDRTQYTSKSWMTRNRIRERGHGPRYIAVPVHGTPLATPISAIRIDHGQPWQQRLRDLICHNYRRAPYFEEVLPIIETALAPAHTFLTECNAAGIAAVCAYLGITTQLVTDSSPYAAWEETAATGTEGRHARIVHICQHERAKCYHNAIGGMSLYERERFQRHGITLRFIHSHVTPYNQGGAEFLPGLSIIDMLMHCGAARTRERLVQYTLA